MRVKCIPSNTTLARRKSRAPFLQGLVALGPVKGDPHGFIVVIFIAVSNSPISEEMGKFALGGIEFPTAIRAIATSAMDTSMRGFRWTHYDLWGANSRIIA